MAVVDITNTPIDIISSTAVSRGVERRLLMLDISKTGNLDPNTHPFFELPAGAGLKHCYFWIHTALVGSSATFRFHRGTTSLGGLAFTAQDAGRGGHFGILDSADQSASGQEDMYDPDATDLSLTVASGTLTAGKLVIEVNWVDVGNAVTTGYREGTGAV